MSSTTLIRCFRDINVSAVRGVAIAGSPLDDKPWSAVGATMQS